MYLDYILIIADYFKTLNKRVIIYEWVVPIVIAMAFSLLFIIKGLPSITHNFNSNVIRVMAVLVGFSITIIIILTTGHSRNLEDIKSHKTKIIMNGGNVTLFRLLIINFTYAVVVEIGLILILLIYPLVLDKVQVSVPLKLIGFAVVLIFVVHVLLLNIRNVTDFCIVMAKDVNTRKPD
jgi:hypothetical protein